MVTRRRPRALVIAVLLLAIAVAESNAAASRAQTTSTDDVAHDSGLQWGFDRIGAGDAWAEGRGGGVVIAVIDSGVALNHEDLAGQLVGGTSCSNTDGKADQCEGSPQDDDGHGTHVAGIAAAASGNRSGIAGIAPDARIMPIKVLFEGDSCADDEANGCPSSGTALDVAAAIRWAVDHGADVINLSLGSTSDDVFGPQFVEALEEAWDAGVIAVIAAGNDYVQTANFADAHAVVVGAVTRGDGVPTYANGVGRARWTVAAPGGDEGDTRDSCAQGGNPLGILSTFWSPDNAEDAYACLSGTSMAAPHVSGALAVLLSMDEYTTARSAVERLVDTAIDLGEPGEDDVFGAGLIDLAAAAGVSPPTTTSSTTITTSTTTATSTTTTAPPGSEPPSTTTTVPAPTPPPVTLDDVDQATGPVVIDDDDRSVGRALAVATGALALSVALSATALRRRGLV